jgi:hypothetical protein
MAGDVDEHSTIPGRDRAQRESKLDPAIASQRLERVTSEALGVNACQDVGAPCHLTVNEGEAHVPRGELECAHLEDAPRCRERYLDDLDGHGVLRKWVRLWHLDKAGGVPSVKALVFTGPRSVAVRDVHLGASDPDDVVVRTLFSGISSGTELLAYRGEIAPDLALDERIGALEGTFTYPFQYG